MTALQQKRAEPIPAVEREPRQNAMCRLAVDALRPLQRLVQTPKTSQRTRAREQRREVRLFVETIRDPGPLLGGARHRFCVVLLIRGLVLDAERLEKRPARTPVRVEEVSCARGGFMCERPSALFVRIAPEIQDRLLDVDLQFDDLVTSLKLASALQIDTRAVTVIERERRSRRCQERARATQRIAPTIRQEEAALERDVVSSKRGCECSNLFVQPERRLVHGVRLVDDGNEQSESVLAEQRPLRRAHEAIRELEAWQSGRMPVTERLTKTPEVVARDLHEPFADAAVDADPLLIGDLAHRGGADQVVRELQRTAGFDSDAARHELARGVLSPFLRPVVELGRVRERKWAGSDRESRKQRAGVGARAAQTRCNESTRVHLSSPTSRERVEPER